MRSSVIFDSLGLLIWARSKTWTKNGMETTIGQNLDLFKLEVGEHAETHGRSTVPNLPLRLPSSGGNELC